MKNEKKNRIKIAINRMKFPEYSNVTEDTT